MAQEGKGLNPAHKHPLHYVEAGKGLLQNIQKRVSGLRLLL